MVGKELAGINTQTVLSGLVLAVLLWVGNTTYETSLNMVSVAARMEALVDTQDLQALVTRERLSEFSAELVGVKHRVRVVEMK
jgi:hypothetical protein